MNRFIVEYSNRSDQLCRVSLAREHTTLKCLEITKSGTFIRVQNRNTTIRVDAQTKDQVDAHRWDPKNDVRFATAASATSM